MSNPKIDWSDLENVEPVPGSEWDGYKIAGHYRSGSENYPHLVVLQCANGIGCTATITDDGCQLIGGPPVVRNKPKRVTLQECWVVYTPDGQYFGTRLTKHAADSYEAIGNIVRRIPAETIEVERS